MTRSLTTLLIGTSPCLVIAGCSVQQKIGQGAEAASRTERPHSHRERHSRPIEHLGRSSDPYVRPLSEDALTGYALDAPPGMEEPTPYPPPERSIDYRYNSHSIEPGYDSMLRHMLSFYGSIST